VEKLDWHVDPVRATWNMNEWIIMRRNEKRTDENFPSETSRLPESGLQKANGEAGRENPRSLSRIARD